MAVVPPNVARVASRWLAAQEIPPQPSFHLPVGLVSALVLGDRVRGMDGVLYEVTAVGPGGLVLESGPNIFAFTNRGFRAYSWAYFAASHLHWFVGPS